MRSLRLALAMLAFCTIPAIAQNAGGTAALKIPTGVYDIVPDSNYAGPDLAGIAFEISGDTLMIARQNGEAMATMKLAIAGSDITITDGENQIGCAGTSKYRLVVDGKMIRLVPVVDTCETRALVMPQVRLMLRGS